MIIAWESFTPWTALTGGALIGVAATLLILARGRVLGVSGIVGGLLRPRGDAAWRVVFLLGMLASPFVFLVIAPDSMQPVRQIDASLVLIVIAGLLVGLGTRYGTGCTSGHGVCGLSRLSPRSLAATLAFMSAGFATVFVLRHLFA